MATITLNGRKFSYTLVRKSISSLRLRLKTRRSFIVSTPNFIPNFLINKFINDHSGWIIKNSVKLASKQKLKLINLKSLSILGVSYEVILRQSSRDSLVIFEDTHQIHLNSPHLTDTHLKTIIDKKLRPLSLKLIKQEISLLSSEFGLKPNIISVRNQTGRFGSCSYQGNLSFNWQIIFFPKEIFRHILLHELTHLAIKDHSSKYWHQLAIYDPHCDAHRLWLKKESKNYFVI